MQEVKDYILSHASIKDSLKKGLINYSKLSRKIITEKNLNKKDFDAIVVALRRLEPKLRSASSEKNIRELLKETSIEIKTKISIYIIEKGTSYKNLTFLKEDLEKKLPLKNLLGSLYIIDGSDSLTIIAPQKYDILIEKHFKHMIIKKQKDTVAIILKSPESLENTPGVVGYLYSLFAEQGINIIETASCWTDTLFVISDTDLDVCLKFLKF
jgi:hypothetical protein